MSAAFKTWYITYTKKKGLFGGGHEFGNMLLKDKSLHEAFLYVESTGSHVLAFSEIQDADDAKFLESRCPPKGEEDVEL